MSTLPIIRSIEGLEFWFNGQDNLFFRVYPGHSINRKSVHHSYKNDDPVDKESVLEELKNYLSLSSSPGAKVTIQTSSTKGGHSNVVQTFYEVPSSNTGITGTGIGDNSMFGLAGGVQGYISSQIQSAVSEIKHEQQLKEKDQEIAALEAALEDKHNPTLKDKIGAGIAADPMAFMDKCMMMLGMAMEKAAQLKNPQIAMATPYNKTTTTTMEEEKEQAATTEQEVPQYTEEQEEAILAALDRISKHMNVADVLPKLADKLDKDASIAGFITNFLN